ncbi:MAG: hypothetical protein U1D06_11235 [Paracoccaceae bacterium]|nr:hypothetical protein [Paracoccaceae bacterium]
MKRLFLSAALALTTLGALPASAAELSTADILEVRKYAPGADLSNLSNYQVIMIQNLIYSDGHNRGGLIRSIIGNG